jgi:hypothetical protein
LVEVVVLTCCWSVKGGAGTTVVAAALALLLADRAPGALLVDVAGDSPAALGLLPEPTGPGIAEWLVAGSEVPADGLARLEVEVAPGLRLIPRGSTSPSAALALTARFGGPRWPGRAEVLASLLAADPRSVVADVGLVDVRQPLDGDVGATLAGLATHSLLVTRPCFLALRRAVAAPLRPSAVVLVEDEGRAIGPLEVEDMLGVPVRARVQVSPSVARAVDAGLLARRLPPSFLAALRHVA